MPVRKQNVYQLVLTKPLACKRGNKIYLKMCWLKPSHASVDRKCISTCVEQIHPMLSNTQIMPQLVLNKSFTRQRNVSQHELTKTSHDNKKRTFFYICTDQTHFCQQLYNKYLKWGHKIYLNLCWPNTSHAIEDTKCVQETFIRLNTFNATEDRKVTQLVFNISASTQNLS